MLYSESQSHEGGFKWSQPGVFRLILIIGTKLPWLVREAALKMSESGNVRVLVIHGSRARDKVATDRALEDNV